MGMCPACKADNHSQHRGHYSVACHRKGSRRAGRNVPSRQVECTCQLCTTDGSWRGTPQPLPHMPATLR